MAAQPIIPPAVHVALFFLSAMLASPLVIAAGECTREEAMAAEEATDHLTNWKRIFEAFEHFALCDDGAIAEGFTDSVVRLLSTHWETLPQFAALADKNAIFRAFVLRHVDESADADDLKHVVRLAKTKCPKGQHHLCAAISKAAVGEKVCPLTLWSTETPKQPASPPVSTHLR